MACTLLAHTLILFAASVHSYSSELNVPLASRVDPADHALSVSAAPDEGLPVGIKDDLGGRGVAESRLLLLHQAGVDATASIREEAAWLISPSAASSAAALLQASCVRLQI